MWGPALGAALGQEIEVRRGDLCGPLRAPRRRVRQEGGKGRETMHRRRRTTSIPIDVARTNRRSRVAPSPNGICHPSPNADRGDHCWSPVPRTNGSASIDYASWRGQASQASWLSAICLDRHSQRQMADRRIDPSDIRALITSARGSVHRSFTASRPGARAPHGYASDPINLLIRRR